MSCIVTNFTTNANTPVPCNNVVGSDNFFGGGVAYTNYGYMVNETAANVFLGFFITATILHFALGVYNRTLFVFFTFCFGGAIEAVGWAGRYWSAHTTFWDPNQGGQWNNNNSGYLMQIICLIIAPTFFSAGNYIILGHLIDNTGDRFSSLTAKSFTVLFTTTDVICLIIQGLGGGLTGNATTDQQTADGLHVMAIGVVLQLVLTVVFIGFYTEFVVRINRHTGAKAHDQQRPFKVCFRRNKPMDASGAQKEYLEASKSRENTVLAALGLAILLITMRGLFRCDELLGFSQYSTSGAYYNQNLFIGMDATLMLLLLITYIVVHPGLMQMDMRMAFGRDV